MAVKIEINQDYQSLLPFINELASNGVPSDATLIYSARNRVYTIERGGYLLNIKAFRCPSFPNCYVYGRFRQTKARRSYQNSLRLAEMGFRAPTPVAYIEETAAGRMGKCYYVSLQLKADDLRDWVKKPDREPLLRALAAEMVRLHRAGVFHKDFSPGNVLYTSNGGEYQFYLIDLNRMQFDVRSHSTLMRNFRSIYIENEAETVHLARLYAEAAGLDVAATEGEARAQFAAYHRQKKFNRRIKSLFK